MTYETWRERECGVWGTCFWQTAQSLTLSQGETSWRVRCERSSCVQSVHRYVHVLTAKPSVLSASERLQILFIFVHKFSHPFLCKRGVNSCFSYCPREDPKTSCQFCSNRSATFNTVFFFVPASSVTHEDHGFGETSSCPVRTVVPPQGTIFGSNQPQLFQVFSSCHKCVLVPWTVARWSSFSIFLLCPAIPATSYSICAGNGLPPHGDTGTCQMLDKEMELRKDANNHGVHAARTQPEGAHHVENSSFSSYTLQLANTVTYTALDVAHCQISSHNRVNNFCQYLHLNSFSCQGTCTLFFVALQFH